MVPPTCRFAAGSGQPTGVWRSCSRSSLAKGTHCPRCAETRRCWQKRTLPWKRDWQSRSGTYEACQSSWQRPGKGRQETLGGTLLKVCNYNGGGHDVRNYCLLCALQMFLRLRSKETPAKRKGYCDLNVMFLPAQAPKALFGHLLGTPCTFL